MGVLLGMLIGILGIGLVLSIRLLTTFFHEMGHAIPALLFTKGPVHVFIGTYGDLSRSTPIVIGRLRLHIRLALLDWKIGMCQHEGSTHFWALLLIILGGPVMSLLIAVPLLLLIIQQGLSDHWLVVAMIFLLAAIIDFLVNIIPVHREIGMYDGSVTYNDGYKLYLLVSRLFLSSTYLQLEERYLAGDYTRVITEIEKQLAAGYDKADLHDLLISAYVANQQYQEAIAAMHAYQQKFKMRYKDYATLGDLYLKTNVFEQAARCYQHCINKRYGDAHVLAQRAMIYLHQGEYREALLDLNGAVEHAPHASEYLAKRGYVKLLQKDFAGARADMESAKRLNDQHPYTYYYLGLYHESQQEYALALDYYTTAQKMGIKEHSIEFRMQEMEQRLASLPE